MHHQIVRWLDRVTRKERTAQVTLIVVGLATLVLVFFLLYRVAELGHATDVNTDKLTGPQGDSIASISCDTANTWKITLTSGKVLNGGGPCRAETMTVTASPTAPSSTQSPTSTATP